MLQLSFNTVKSKFKFFVKYICVCVRACTNIFSSSIKCDFLRHYGLQTARLFCLWNFPGKNTGAGCQTLGWVGISYSWGSFRPRD